VQRAVVNEIRRSPGYGMLHDTVLLAPLVTIILKVHLLLRHYLFLLFLHRCLFRLLLRCRWSGLVALDAAAGLSSIIAIYVS
jgi:hypothetical protein